MPKNTGDFQFCHFCYCILFPEYAIMPLVTSVIMHSCSMRKKILARERKKTVFDGTFSHPKVCENAVQSDSSVKRRIRLRVTQRKVSSYEDDNQNSSSE